MADHPYRSLPPHCFWPLTIANVPYAEVDPVVRAKFPVSRSDRIATAGSCFAQHIARHLTQHGFNYLVTETAHPLVAEFVEHYNYGVFTARYGNIYTSRQLLQTLQRAYGLFVPRDQAWPAEDGRVIDPYRPIIQTDGFACLAELIEDRKRHFAAIRRAIEEMDVFVFTLGLTEAWVNHEDGAVYPMCPGVGGGSFDPAQHGFVNYTVREVSADLEASLALIAERNPRARVLLTVSPVPLLATVEDRSVLVSTTYSKSVLRVAAEEVAAQHAHVAYFPSYEVITGNFSRCRYYGDDLRAISEEGVSHVMRLFLKHYAGEALPMTAAQATPDTAQQTAERRQRELAEVVAVICDEERLQAEADRRARAVTSVPDAANAPVPVPAPAVSSAPTPPAAAPAAMAAAVAVAPPPSATLSMAATAMPEDSASALDFLKGTGNPPAAESPAAEPAQPPARSRSLLAWLRRA